ncbi:unnamed protein product [Caenorhabditis bovis]|uniref:Membrane protein BRI3 n=1 Tax=Caenorhabditis bovis TaxID=2654633 RepID=A0A8S1EXE3_9PELO|nr:unnamed protein product [Caenorhabditis bovis]
MSDNEMKKQPMPEESRNPAEGASSAPPMEEANTQRNSNSFENVANAQVERQPPPPPGIRPLADLQNQTTQPNNSQQSPYDAPPPSYQTAMSYPAAPTYGGGAGPKYNGQPPIYNPHPLPAITQVRLPQPPQTGNTIRVENITPNVVLQVQSGPTCPQCRNGIVIRQTDMCCLLSLILLTIFTFPCGLIFLCCVPCTIQNRCTNCNRLAV